MTEKEKLQRDQFLTEAMGECWHRPKQSSPGLACKKCNEYLGSANYDRFDFPSAFNVRFSTWEGFGKLWAWVRQQEWWGTFRYLNCAYFWDGSIIDPDYFANIVYQILRSRE